MLFADDANVFLNGREANELETIMNGELLKIVDWLDSRGGGGGGGGGGTRSGYG